MTSIMNDHEYDVMAHVERDHWWYRGLRDLIGRLLVREGFANRSGLRVLDAGCGTGENLCMLHELLDTAYLGGFDWSPRAVEYARAKAPDIDIYRSDLCVPEFHADEYDLVLSCDVLCTIGLEGARPGMLQIVERIRPGGLLMLNLPAYQWLFSRHDVAVATRERFTAPQVGRFLVPMGLTIELLSYRLCALFPAIVTARLPSMLFGPRNPTPHSDLSIPNALINRCLAWALRWENRAILRGVRFPWGSSVFVVARRK